MSILWVQLPLPLQLYILKFKPSHVTFIEIDVNGLSVQRIQPLSFDDLDSFLKVNNGPEIYPFNLIQLIQLRYIKPLMRIFF